MAHELEPNQAVYEECRQKLISTIEQLHKGSNASAQADYTTLDGCFSFLIGALSALFQLGIVVNSEEFKALG